MNIFAVDADPGVCARYLDDKRLVKMVLETTQLLCTAINEHGGKSPYKTTHKNHPCAVWVRQTRCNYAWTLDLLAELCAEYTLRYGKTHKCEQYLLQLLAAASYIPDGDLTPFPNCARNKSLGLDFTSYDNVHLAYRDYLAARWANDKKPASAKLGVS